jgi:hypothetical protein
MTKTTSRRPAAAASVLLVLSALALGACSKTDPASASAPARPQVSQASAQQASGSDTIDLVNAAADTPAAGETPKSADRRGLPDRLLRALHATWVTESQQGPVTHQAIRGEVTAVSATSITVKAKDGVSLTFAVTRYTTVRQRVAGSGKGNGIGRATASTIGTVTVGTKALVTGVGATAPTARLIVHVAATAPKPAPSASSTTG